MAVAQLRRAAPLPGIERVLRRAGGRRRIAVEDGDAARAAAEGQRGAKPRDAAAGNQNVFVLLHHTFNRAAASASAHQPMMKLKPPNGVTKASGLAPVNARR